MATATSYDRLRIQTTVAYLLCWHSEFSCGWCHVCMCAGAFKLHAKPWRKVHVTHKWNMHACANTLYVQRNTVHIVFKYHTYRCLIHIKRGNHFLKYHKLSWVPKQQMILWQKVNSASKRTGLDFKHWFKSKLRSFSVVWYFTKKCSSYEITSKTTEKITHTMTLPFTHSTETEPATQRRG